MSDTPRPTPPACQTLARTEPDGTDVDGATNLIGQLALRSGLLTAAQVLKVLERQANDPILFGEACIDLDFLTRDQVNALLVEQLKIRKREASPAPRG